MVGAALGDLGRHPARYATSVIAVAVIVAVVLVVSGISTAFGRAVDRTLDQSRADRWVAATSAPGPFSAGIAIPMDAVDFREALGGVRRADPVVYVRAAADVDGTARDIGLFGVVFEGLGAPQPSEGRVPVESGEALVSRQLAGVGDELVVLNERFTVVGTVERASLSPGAPSVFVGLTDAQRLAANGLNYASMILTEGVPRSVPRGFTAFNRERTRADLVRAFRPAGESIAWIRAALSFVAALIVVAAVDPSRRRHASATAVALRAALVALVGALLGAVLALLTAPHFPMDVDVSWRSRVLVALLPIGVGLIGLVAGAVGRVRTGRGERRRVPAGNVEGPW